ncbi:hypothetical protein C5167_041005, partial [Papaver somniferum]
VTSESLFNFGGAELDWASYPKFHSSLLSFTSDSQAAVSETIATLKSWNLMLMINGIKSVSIMISPLKQIKSAFVRSLKDKIKEGDKMQRKTFRPFPVNVKLDVNVVGRIYRCGLLPEASKRSFVFFISYCLQGDVERLRCLRSFIDQTYASLIEPRVLSPDCVKLNTDGILVIILHVPVEYMDHCSLRKTRFHHGSNMAELWAIIQGSLLADSLGITMFHGESYLYYQSWKRAL